jgi:hypothetical protein
MSPSKLKPSKCRQKFLYNVHKPTYPYLINPNLLFYLICNSCGASSPFRKGCQDLVQKSTLSVFDILEVNILEVNILEVDILEFDILEVDILEVNILEVDIFEVDIFEVNILEVDILKVNILEGDIFGGNILKVNIF